MAELPVPAGAIGRHGMIAWLKGAAADIGDRLIVVREPAGFLSAVIGLEKPTFCWLVRLLGPMLEIRGKPARDIYAPDRCLVPFGSMSDDDLQTLIKSQGAADFSAALQDLREAVGATDMPLDEFESFVNRASAQIDIVKALEIVPIPVALREIGFVPPHVDSETLVWAGVHAGMELRFLAGLNMWFGWTLLATGNSRDRAVCNETNLPSEAPRGQIVATVLKIWHSAFPGAPVPDAMALGATYQAHKRLMSRASVATSSPAQSLPTLHPDPVAFRSIRKWLLGAGPMGLPTGDDTWLQMHQDGAMLRIELDGMPYGCPAHGRWAGPREVRFSDFAAMPASVLRSRWLTLAQDGDSLLVNEWRLPSRAKVA